MNLATQIHCSSECCKELSKSNQPGNLGVHRCMLGIEKVGTAQKRCVLQPRSFSGFQNWKTASNMNQYASRKY